VLRWWWFWWWGGTFKAKGCKLWT